MLSRIQRVPAQASRLPVGQHAESFAFGSKLRELAVLPLCHEQVNCLYELRDAESALGIAQQKDAKDGAIAYKIAATPNRSVALGIPAALPSSGAKNQDITAKPNPRLLFSHGSSSLKISSFREAPFSRLRYDPPNLPPARPAVTMLSRSQRVPAQASAASDPARRHAPPPLRRADTARAGRFAGSSQAHTRAPRLTTTRRPRAGQGSSRRVRRSAEPARRRRRR